MKILKKVMLGLLISLCATIAVVVVMHIFGGDDNPQPQRTRADRVAADEAEDADITSFLTEEDEYRFWQRAATRSQETGYWQYYPIIPWNVLPGETVVLSVSAEGHKGWEADPYFAPVELFDEKTDGENAYISFIMPNDRVSIAALYENSIPGINFDNTQDMISVADSMREHGAAFVAASASGIVPELGDAYTLDPVTLLQLFYINFSDPAPDETLPQDSPYRDMDLCWHWDFRSPQFDGFRWTPFAGGGGQLWGFPETVGGPHEFGVTISYCDGPCSPAHKDTNVRGIYWFEITVRPDTGTPSIRRTTFVPDAMVGVWYDWPFETTNFASDSRWTWEASRGTTGLPANSGLSMWVDPTDVTQWAIRGTPTAAASGLSYNFIIDMHQSFPDARTIASNVLNIKVWPRPVLTPPGESASPETITPLLAGIANIPNSGVDKQYNIPTNNTPIVATGPDIDNPLGMAGANWEWRISAGSLPPGLSLTPVTSDNTALISGRPTLPGNYEFTVRYTTNTDPDRGPVVLIGWEERRYSIEILHPPWFDMDMNPVTRIIRLADGMEDQPGTAEPEEPDDWYNEPISIAGLPIGTSWEWRVSAGTNPISLGLAFEPPPPNIHVITSNGTSYPHHIDLVGVPNHDAGGDYKFTIELLCIDLNNSNINGAIVTQEFEMKIWPRTYLYVAGTGSRLYVRRDSDDPNIPPDGLDWADLSTLGPAALRPYESRRAVMPGTRAIVSTNSGGAFVRWDISHSYETTLGDDFGTPELPLSYSAGSTQFFRDGGIGGPDHTGPSGVRTGYGIFPAPPATGRHAYAVVNMPRTPTTGTYDGNVFLRAEQLGNINESPGITGSGVTGPVAVSPSSRGALREGTVGGGYEATISINRHDMGSGPGAMRMQIIPGRGDLPRGLEIVDEYQGSTVFIGGIPVESKDDPFEFSVSLTLPGTMRIERDFSIFVNPWDGLGDVNGDGVVDLRDLVLLVRFQDDDTLNINLRNARLRTNGEGNHRPDIRDIRLLARYFTHSQGSFRPEN